MLTVHWRMAELWTTQQKRDLTESEVREMGICLQANANYARKLARLYNLSGMASQTDDIDWLHEICADIDKLELEYRVSAR